MKPLAAIDLCCGGGGWACAARGLPIQVLLAVDHWAPACKTYALNHPGTRVLYGDLREPAVAREIRAHRGVDLVVGGIPCEWLSVYRAFTKAGQVRAPERAAQRATLDSVLALCAALAPRYWCLEDVIQILPELPPLTPYQIIDAQHYSGQRRRRAYVGSFPSPRPERNPKTLAAYLRPGPFRIGARTASRDPATGRTFTAETFYAAHADRKCPTVCAGGSRHDAEIALVCAVRGGKRQLEWQELAAAQGFPADYVFHGSPTDVAKMIGRAIQIDTGRAILGAIVDAARHSTAPIVAESAD